MNKKNGFIATSILYTFFLVFITLFVALITNYIHNQVLIGAIDEASWKQLMKINNTKISDLKVGDRIILRTDKSNTTTSGLLNDGVWIVARIDEIAKNQTYKYYFISDADVQKSSFIYVKGGTKNKRKYSVSVDVYEELQKLGYYKNVLRYNVNKADNKKIQISLPTISVLQSIRNSNASDIIKNSIFNVGDAYVVYSDSKIGSYEANQYYNYRRYNFEIGNIGKKTANNLSYFKEYCNVEFNSTTNKVDYTGDIFSYAHVQEEAQVAEGQTEKKKYVEYCMYASPIVYNHYSSDNVVNYNELNTSDLISNKLSAGYGLRLMGTVTVDVNDESTYIAGGKGLATDPYILTDGGKR